VWAVVVLLSAAVFLSAAGSAVTTGAEALGGIAAFAGSNTNNPLDAVMDTMVRPTTVAHGPAPAPAAPPRRGYECACLRRCAAEGG
jgi:hypothetical protein